MTRTKKPKPTWKHTPVWLVRDTRDYGPDLIQLFLSEDEARLESERIPYSEVEQHYVSGLGTWVAS